MSEIFSASLFLISFLSLPFPRVLCGYAHFLESSPLTRVLFSRMLLAQLFCSRQNQGSPTPSFASRILFIDPAYSRHPFFSPPKRCPPLPPYLLVLAFPRFSLKLSSSSRPKLPQNLRYSGARLKFSLPREARIVPTLSSRCPFHLESRFDPQRQLLLVADSPPPNLCYSFLSQTLITPVSHPAPASNSSFFFSSWGRHQAANTVLHPVDRRNPDHPTNAFWGGDLSISALFLPVHPPYFWPTSTAPPHPSI